MIRFRPFEVAAVVTAAALLAACGLMDPASHDGDPTAVSLTSAPSGTCARLAEGTTRCWGSVDVSYPGGPDLLGLGPVLSPTQVALPSGSDLHVSNSALFVSACARTSAGAVTCGGSVLDGYSDGGASLGTFPQPVTGASALTTITLGPRGGCGLDADGAAHCWGSYAGGVRGAGDSVGDPAPAASLASNAVTGGLHFTQVVAMQDDVCGLTGDGHVYCWGGVNGLGGDSTGLDTGVVACGKTFAAACALDPRPIQSGLTFTELSAGTHSACAVTTGGAVLCWGANSAGALGSGDTLDSRVPVTALASGASHVVTSTFFTCASSAGGSVWCWGDRGANASLPGPLGTTSSLTPVLVASGHPYVQLVAGDEHVCGLLASGVVECWGRNSQGQLGTGDTLAVATPTAVAF